MATDDRTNHFAETAEASWHSACHEEIPDPDHIVEDLARPEPDQGTGDSPNHAA